MSASFSEEIAHSNYVGHDDVEPNGMLLRALVPVERILMSYLKTAAMNRNYLEAEATLFADPAGAFL